MNHTTIQRLKDAALQAVQDDDIAAARDLLDIISVQKIMHKPLQLKASSSDEVGVLHDSLFWSQIVRDSFVPFLTQHGRSSFTSPELFKWIVNWDGVTLSQQDLQRHEDGREIWRDRAYQGLTQLCQMGVLSKEYGSKVYYIAEVDNTLV